MGARIYGINTIIIVRMNNSNSFSLRRLIVEGPRNEPAELIFADGLNAIVGASNTGKSYAFQVLEHLLGSDRIPKDNPHGRGYNRGILELMTSEGASFHIERTFGDSNVRWRIGREGDEVNPLIVETIAASHKKGESSTLSRRLLALFGFEEYKILASEKTGEKNEVSFRNVAWLTMVDEMRIIKDSSPALTGQWLLRTAEQRIWNLFMTGLDDADLAANPPSKKERNISIDAKIEWISNYIAQQELALKDLPAGEDDVEERSRSVDEALRMSSEVVSANSAQISALEEKRKDIWRRLVAIKDRLTVVQEHLSRFRLLMEYYETDLNRLAAVIEAGASFESLSTGHCAVCGMLPDNSSVSETAIETFTVAANLEMEKVRVLAKDLRETIGALELEENQLIEDEAQLSSDRKVTNIEIERELKPRAVIASDSIQELVRLKVDLDRVRGIKEQLEKLRADLHVWEVEKKKKVPKAAKLEKVSTRTAAAFCKVVENTLRTWKYPLAGNVAFDPQNCDIVIGNQDRGSMGKGHRALTHAAFTIALMRYCREHEAEC